MISWCSTVCFLTAFHTSLAASTLASSDEKDTEYAANFFDANCRNITSTLPEFEDEDSGKKTTFEWKRFNVDLNREIEAHFASSPFPMCSKMTFGPTINFYAPLIAREQGRMCVLGKYAACLVIAIKSLHVEDKITELNLTNLFKGLGLDDCVDLVTNPPEVKTILGTTWPIFGLLSMLQVGTEYRTNDLCEEEDMNALIVQRPVLKLATEYIENSFSTTSPKLYELFDMDLSDEETQKAWEKGRQKNAEVLKAADETIDSVLREIDSKAMVDGKPIRIQVRQCSLGIKTAYAMRALKIAIRKFRFDSFDSSLSRIIFELEEIMESSIMYTILKSPWPLFLLLQNLQYVSRLTLESLCVKEKRNSEHCNYYRNVIQSAPNKPMVITSLDVRRYLDCVRLLSAPDLEKRLNLKELSAINKVFQNMYRIGIDHVLVITKDLEEFNNCRSALEEFSGMGQCVIPNSTKKPKLLTKYILIDLALELGKDVLWVEDPFVLLIKNPVKASHPRGEGSISVVQTAQNVGSERLIFSRSLFYAKPEARPLAHSMAEWIRSNPYADVQEQEAWHKLIDSLGINDTKNKSRWSYFEIPEATRSIQYFQLNWQNEFVGLNYIGKRDQVITVDFGTIPLEFSFIVVFEFYAGISSPIAQERWMSNRLEQLNRQGDERLLRKYIAKHFPETEPAEHTDTPRKASKHGHEIIFTQGTSTYHRWFWAGSWDRYEESTFVMFDCILSGPLQTQPIGSTKIQKHGKIVWDIGAWIGFTGIYLAKIADRVIIMEPASSSYEATTRNVNANVDVRHRISVVRKALGLSNRRVRITDNSNASDMVIDDDDVRFGTEVDMVTVDKMVGMFPELTNALLVKVDVEGAEKYIIPALESFLRDSKAALLLEVHANVLVYREVETICQCLARIYPHLYAVDEKMMILYPFHFRAYGDGNRFNMTATELPHIFGTWRSIPGHHRNLQKMR